MFLILLCRQREYRARGKNSVIQKKRPKSKALLTLPCPNSLSMLDVIDANSSQNCSTISDESSCTSTSSYYVDQASDVSNASSTSSSKNSERTIACKARKFLPKDPTLKCRTILRIFLFALSDPETKEIMKSHLLDSQKFKDVVKNLNNTVSQETKEVHKSMRKLYALRSKASSKASALFGKIKEIRKKYSMRRIQAITGITYRQVYRILNPPKVTGGSRNISQEDRLAICRVVLKTVHSMQIPYRRFAKYFYLRESIKSTYLAYVREQQQLGMRILSESAVYKNLPKHVRSRKYIPFMECLCVKCLNATNIMDALKAAGIKLPSRIIINILTSICAFLVDKDEVTPLLTKQEVRQTPSSNTKKIQFGHFEEVEYTNTSFSVTNRQKIKSVNRSNGVETKHDPNKYLLSARNAPEDLSARAVVLNCNPSCMFRECDVCGVHKLNTELLLENPNLPSLYMKEVVWFKWGSFKEKINGKEVVRPFNRYQYNGTLEELLQMFYDSVHNMAKHIYHFKWQADQYEFLRSSIEEGEVGLVMDFGQNISHRKQREPQASHFNRRQSTIFPLVCFFKCVLCGQLVTHNICCITDDLKHDAFAVRAFELEAFKLLEASGVTLKKVYEWSDNCGLEFKSKYPFYVLSRMSTKICRNYWGENHGKGPADAVIGRVSQVIRSAIASGKTSISHGMDMVLYLQDNMGTRTCDTNKCQHYRNSFLYVDKINRGDLNLTVKTMKGTRDVHSVENTGVPGKLKIRRSTCMCRCFAYIPLVNNFESIHLSRYNNVN